MNYNILFMVVYLKLDLSHIEQLHSYHKHLYNGSWSSLIKENGWQNYNTKHILSLCSFFDKLAHCNKSILLSERASNNDNVWLLLKATLLQSKFSHSLGLFSSKKFSQKVLQYPSHRILRYVYGALNVDEKKRIAQFCWKSRDERFEPN